MTPDPGNLHLERGLLLYHQDRHAAAEAELRLALAEDPHHAVAHAVLALCLAEQGKIDPAADEAGQAVRLAPELAFAHYARAQVFLKQHRPADAEAAAREALRIDHTRAEFHALLAGVLLDRRNAAGAVRAAEEGLSYDPTHAGCSALRTIALLRLGRTADATEETADALRRDPQDALAHAGRGWALLHEKRPADALTHFREALRLDPTNEWARDGLVEALKARYWVYRQMLGFFLWMGRLSPGTQWAVIIGLYLAQRALGAAANNDPALRPFVLPVLYALIGFVLLTYLANPLFTLLLRLNRFGRLVLDREDVRQSNWVGRVILAGLAAALVAVLDDDLPGVLGETTAITCLVLLMPLVTIFRVPAGWRRKVMLAYTVGMALVWGIMVGNFIDADREFRGGRNWAGRTAAKAAWEAFEVNVWAGVLCGFFANALVTFRRS